MARYTGPKHKLCRAEGVALCGSPKCPVIRKNAAPPGQHGAKGRKKLSEYGIQLREKQKVKRMYGILERQFKKYYQLASSKKSATGQTLLEILENRLDNAVYRLNLIKKLKEETKDAKLPSWLAKKATVGKVVARPKRDEQDLAINESLIVEYYSR